MSTKLYAGSFADYTDSMAQEIETALNNLRQQKGLDPLPPGDQDRQMLFIAIATGVITHLQKKEAALKISFSVTGDAQNIDEYPDIQVRNP